jgi:hypothetical protein
VPEEEWLCHRCREQSGARALRNADRKVGASVGGSAAAARRGASVSPPPLHACMISQSLYDYLPLQSYLSVRAELRPPAPPAYLSSPVPPPSLARSVCRERAGAHAQQQGPSRRRRPPPPRGAGALPGPAADALRAAVAVWRGGCGGSRSHPLLSSAHAGGPQSTCSGVPRRGSG